MYFSQKKKCHLWEGSLFNKTVRIMKLTILLLLIAVFQVSAKNMKAQRITLHEHEAPLTKIFKAIRQQSAYNFLYADDALNGTTPVSISVKNKDVKAVLDEIFQQQPISYTITDNTIIIKRKAVYPAQTTAALAAIQQLEIQGIVNDELGNPIAGASVIIKRTGRGAITNDRGAFRLQVEQGDVLTITYIGKQAREINIQEGKSDYTITLMDEQRELQQIVVTALGIKRESKALGYSVQTVQGDDLQTVKGVDVGTSLTGRVAGLLVKNSTEFTQAPDIQLRGENPLLVIDGVPYGNMTLRDIAPDDIQSITVLKGATASALYGFRGAGGAIMVTTKKGTNKNGLSVTVNSSSMFTAGFLAIPKMQSTYGRVVNTATNTYARTGDGAWGVPMEGQPVIQWDPISKSMKEMPYLPVGKNNFRNFLDQGYVLNNNIQVIQQGELGSFHASASWVENKGQYPNSKYSKLRYSIGGDIKLDKFTLSTTLSYNKQSSPNIGFSGYTGYDPMYSMLVWSAPDYDIRQYKDYWLIKNEVQNSSYTAGINNPYFDRYERIHNVNRDIFNGSLELNYDFTPWLKGTFRTGYDTYSDKQEIRISEGSFQGAGASTVIPGGTEVWGESARGSFNTGLSRGYSTNNDLLLTAKFKEGDFKIDGFVGGTIYYRQDEGIEALTQGGLSVPAFYSLKASINPAKVNSVTKKQQVNSIYGRGAVSWKDMLFAEATLRNDWSSTLPSSTRSYLYPSVSGSFVASELLPKSGWLNFWKWRGSWTSSKTPADIYSINTVYGITNNSWGDLSSALLPTTIRGANVHPESSSTFEVGTEASMFGNLLSVDISYYDKRMYDFLKSTGISAASGYAANYINIQEEISRRGWEVFTKITPVKTKDWRWDVTLNWSTYARYYTKLDPQFSADKPWVKVGQRVDAYILRDYQKDPEGNIIHSNGLPLYSNYDSRYGYSDPDWIWGAETSLRYKNWSFSIALDGRSGGLAQTTTEMYMWLSGNHPGSVTPERYLDATNPGSKNYIGQGVKVVSGEATYDTYGNITSDTRKYAPNDVPVTYKDYISKLHKGTAWGGAAAPVDVYSTTFFKIREVSLTYSLPKSVYDKIHAKGLSVSAIGQNVFMWAKQFKYSDPDGGVENFSDPSQRFIGLNIKVNF